MTIDPRLRARALQTIRENRARRQAELQRRRSEVYAAVPRISEIDAQLRRDAADAAIAALQGSEDPAGTIAALRDESLDLQAERAELLVENGWPMDWLDDTPACKKCGDAGYVGAAPCQCLLDLARQYQVQELSSLLDTQGAGFDSFDFRWYSDAPDPRYGVSPRENAERAYEFCVEYARKFGTAAESLFLNGGTGLGKTFLSACIAREVAGQGFSVVYDTAVSILEAFETAHFDRENASEAREKTDRVLRCDLLIMDDLGTELTTAFTQSALYTIVNTRLMEGRKTVINSNLTMEELRRRYSPQILSRLEGAYTTIFLFGKDIRLQKKAER